MLDARRRPAQQAHAQRERRAAALAERLLASAEELRVQRPRRGPALAGGGLPRRARRLRPPHAQPRAARALELDGPGAGDVAEQGLVDDDRRRREVLAGLALGRGAHVLDVAQ